MQQKDDDDVEFFVTQKEDQTLYTAYVSCRSGIDKEEFCAALRVLADGIETGNFDFDDDSISDTITTQ